MKKMNKVLIQILLIILSIGLGLYLLGLMCLPIILLFTDLHIWWSILTISVVILVVCIIAITIVGSRGEDWDE